MTSGCTSLSKPIWLKLRYKRPFAGGQCPPRVSYQPDQTLTGPFKSATLLPVNDSHSATNYIGRPTEFQATCCPRHIPSLLPHLELNFWLRTWPKLLCLIINAAFLSMLSNFEDLLGVSHFTRFQNCSDTWFLATRTLKWCTTYFGCIA